MKTTPPWQELLERLHLVPLDEPEDCLCCGREAMGGLYLENRVRPLCIECRTTLVSSGHGKRLDEALQSLNELGQRAPREEARKLHAAAARQLQDWLNMRQAERRNGRATVESLP